MNTKRMVILALTFGTVLQMSAGVPSAPVVLPIFHYYNFDAYEINPDDSDAPYFYSDAFEWDLTYGGFLSSYYEDHRCAEYWTFVQTCWPGNDWPPSQAGNAEFEGFDCNDPWDDSWSADPVSVPWVYAQAQNAYFGTFGPNWEYHESIWAQTIMQLRTGGPTGSSQENLWRISVSAESPYGSIPATNITVLGKTADTNGHVFALLADNSAPDVTPVLPAAFTNYGFDIGHTKAVLKIMRGTNDITDTTNTVVVGEQIALNCLLSPGIATITNFQWTVPGSTISNYVPSTPVSLLHSNLNTTNASIYFHWYQPGTDLEVQCTAIAKGVSMTAKTKFNVLAPTCTLQICPSNSVRVSTTYLGSGSNSLSFGDGVSVAGMYFTATANSLVETNFAIGFLQTLDTQRSLWFSNSPPFKNISATALLDDPFPYGNFTGTTNLALDDSPGIVFPNGSIAGSLEDRFKLHLMYKSNKGNSIWVPLLSVPWGWRGDATNFAGAAWVLVGTNIYFSPTNCTFGANASSFPQWTNTYSNVKTNLSE